MSKKDDNHKNDNSFEYEDRISNVIITPKNKDNNINLNQKQKNFENDIINKTSSIHNNMNINNKNIQNLNENSSLNKINGLNFSNAEMEFLNGINSQIGINNNQNLNGVDQQKLFETFLLFQKFLSNQSIPNNQNVMTNINTNIPNKGINSHEENNVGNIPHDYIHQRKKSKGTLSNSNIIANEFKRSNTNNFYNNIERANSKENLHNIIEKSENNTIDANNLKIKNNNLDHFKEKDVNSNLYKNDQLNPNINKTGFNRLKNKNMSISKDKEYDKETKETENKKSLNNINNENLTKKIDSPNKVSMENNNMIKKGTMDLTPGKDIEFSNRSSFDMRKENIPNNFENGSAKIVEKFQNRNSNPTNNQNTIINEPFSNSINKNNNKKEINNIDLLKKQESNDSVIKMTENKKEINVNNTNNIKTFKKKLNEEDFLQIPKIEFKDNDVKKNNILEDKNNVIIDKQNDIPGKIDNFDEIPIKSSNTNFLELFEKNLAAEQANVYGTLNYELSNNNENKKPVIRKNNNKRFKKEINITAPSKETKKYKYYSDNFEEKPTDGGYENEKDKSNVEMNINNNYNERISFGNYKTEKNPKQINNSNNNSKIFGANKSVEKTKNKKYDKSKNIEDKNNNSNLNNLNGDLARSTNISTSKSKITSATTRKNPKYNPLSSSVNSESFTFKEKENNNNKSSQKLNAETSLKNLKNNIVNKKNIKAEQDNLGNQVENTLDKIEILKNYKEISDIPEIKNIIYSNKKDISFPSGDKNLITFGTLGKENNVSLNKNNSTPQFTIGFNAPSLNQPSTLNNKKEDNKVSKIIKNLIPYSNTNEDAIEENFTNENESPIKHKYEINNLNNKFDEDNKNKHSQDDELKFFNDINKKINDRINLPIAKEVNNNFSKKQETIKNQNTNKETISAKDIKSIQTNNANNVKSSLEKNSSEELYNEKLKELEREIDLLKSENENVANLKQEYQKLFFELNEEIDNFYLKKEQEKKEFEKWKDEEIKKIQKEKKANENKSTGKINQNIIPSKKDKEEIECLKNIIAKMQEEYKIKDNNNKLTIEKLKRKLDESNIKILELNKVIEDLNQKNILMKSNSTNIMKINNNQYPNLGGNSNSSNNIHGNNRRIINYNEGNSINNINNNSTNISPSTQGLMNKNIEELNSNKTNKSMNLQLNGLSGSNLNNILNNSNNIQNQNKQKYNSQRISDDLNKIITKQISKKDSKDFKELSIGNNNLNNKSIEINKKLSSEFDKIKQNTSVNNNIISEGNLNEISNPYDDGIYDLVFLEKYHPRNDLKNDVSKIENFPDGKIVKFYENEKREVIFPSGVRKEIFPDGYQIVYFNNKDIKQVFPNGKQIYFFSDANTIQTTFPDNLQVFKFENGQIEKHFSDGYKQIIFPDGTHKVIFEDQVNQEKII